MLQQYRPVHIDTPANHQKSSTCLSLMLLPLMLAACPTVRPPECIAASTLPAPTLLPLSAATLCQVLLAPLAAHSASHDPAVLQPLAMPPSAVHTPADGRTCRDSPSAGPAHRCACRPRSGTPGRLMHRCSVLQRPLQRSSRCRWQPHRNWCCTCRCRGLDCGSPTHHSSTWQHTTQQVQLKDTN